MPKYLKSEIHLLTALEIGKNRNGICQENDSHHIPFVQLLPLNINLMGHTWKRSIFF